MRTKIFKLTATVILLVTINVFHIACKKDVKDQNHNCPQGQHWDEVQQKCIANLVVNTIALVNHGTWVAFEGVDNNRVLDHWYVDGVMTSSNCPDTIPFLKAKYDSVSLNFNANNTGTYKYKVSNKQYDLTINCESVLYSATDFWVTSQIKWQYKPDENAISITFLDNNVYSESTTMDYIFLSFSAEAMELITDNGTWRYKFK